MDFSYLNAVIKSTASHRTTHGSQWAYQLLLLWFCPGRVLIKALGTSRRRLITWYCRPVCDGRAWRFFGGWNPLSRNCLMKMGIQMPAAKE
jgi:hypothetical protein